jgi:hypothetical protein
MDCLLVSKPQLLGSLSHLSPNTTGGGITMAEGLHEWKVGPYLVWIMPWHLLYTLRKARKNCQFSRVDKLLAALNWTFSEDSPHWLAEHVTTSVIREKSQSVFATHICPPGCRNQGPLHQLTCTLNSQSVIWCGQRKVVSPNPREFACYQHISVEFLQWEDIWIVNLAASGIGCGPQISRWHVLNPSQERWGVCREARCFWQKSRFCC